MKLIGSFSDGTSSRIKNKLKTICLSEREIEKKRVAVVKFRMNKRGGYGGLHAVVRSMALRVSNVI